MQAESDKITVIPHAFDQQQILFWNRRVGFCGYGERKPVNFLTDSRNQCGLTDEEKREVVRYVDRNVGRVKRTPTIERLFGHDYRLDSSGYIASE